MRRFDGEYRWLCFPCSVPAPLRDESGQDRQMVRDEHRYRRPQASGVRNCNAVRAFLVREGERLSLKR